MICKTVHQLERLKTLLGDNERYGDRSLRIEGKGDFLVKKGLAIKVENDYKITEAGLEDLQIASTFAKQIKSVELFESTISWIGYSIRRFYPSTKFTTLRILLNISSKRKRLKDVKIEGISYSTIYSHLNHGVKRKLIQKIGKEFVITDTGRYYLITFRDEFQ